MKQLPLISIIINCYNGEKYLNECLSSISNQTYKNYEVIFWDNNSTDNSKSLFLKNKDKRLKYYSDNKHVNLYDARNKALNLVNGKYITFLDVDDLWVADKLKLQVNIMESNSNIGFCYSGFKFLYEKSDNINSAYNNNKLKNGKITNHLLKNYNVGLLTLMLNADIVNSNNIKFDNRFNIMGDMDFVLRLSRVSLAVPIKSDLAIYRRHANNLSSKLDLTVKERKIWQSEMLNSTLFLKKELKPFFEETKYLDFRNEMNSLITYKSIKKLFFLRGIFFFKGLIIFFHKLKNLKNKNRSKI